MAVGLNLGGIDFLPKFYGISHATKLDIFLKHEQIYNNLIHIITENNKILSVDFSSNVYKDFMKHVYCPILFNPSSLTYQEVRQISIQIPNPKKKEVRRNPQLWMPPELVVEQLSKNVSCLIQYYLSAGNHSAQLPDFLTNGCLTKTKTGEIEYDFGEHAYISDLQSLLTIP